MRALFKCACFTIICCIISRGQGGGGLTYLTYYYCKVENCASCHTEAVGLVLRVSHTNSGVSLTCCADSCVVCLL